MKNQALFSLNDISKTLKYRLLQFLFGSLKIRVDPTFEGLHFPGKETNRKTRSCFPSLKQRKNINIFLSIEL